jgi:hypothetical protein
MAWFRFIAVGIPTVNRFLPKANPTHHECNSQRPAGGISLCTREGRGRKHDR